MPDVLMGVSGAAETVGNGGITIGGAVIAAIVAFLLGMSMSVIYIRTNQNSVHSQHFMLTITILPAIIAVVIMLVGSNVAYAFSLVGTLSIVRFRSSFADPKDITFILIALAIGLACGVGQIIYAALFAIIFAVFMIIIHVTNFGSAGERRILKILVPEDLDYEGAFDDILEQSTWDSKLEKVRTTDLGSLYELTYSLTMRSHVTSKALIDQLRCRNGNLNITLVLEKIFEYEK